jgi:hypothetical protein
VPGWVALAAPVAALLGTAVTLWFTNRREEKRQEYEQERQEREIEERRWATLRDERLRAYSTFARLTKMVDAKNPSPETALGEAHSEIEMLTANPELILAATILLQEWGEAWEYVQRVIEEGEENPYSTAEFINFRNRLDGRRTVFMRLAKDETKPPAPTRPPQEGTQRHWWRGLLGE